MFCPVNMSHNESQRVTTSKRGFGIYIQMWWPSTLRSVRVRRAVPGFRHWRCLVTLMIFDVYSICSCFRELPVGAACSKLCNTQTDWYNAGPLVAIFVVLLSRAMFLSSISLWSFLQSVFGLLRCTLWAAVAGWSCHLQFGFLEIIGNQWKS